MKRLLLLTFLLVVAGAAPAYIDFGKLPDGRTAHLYRLVGADGMTIEVSDYGGRLVNCLVPDRTGLCADVALGFNAAALYETNGFPVGTLVVGPKEWGSRMWQAQTIVEMDEKTHQRVPGVELTLSTGSGGDPAGSVTCKATYRVRPGNVVTLDFEATAGSPTDIGLAHCGYWNLAGESSGDIRDHELEVFSESYVRAKDGRIPDLDDSTFVIRGKPGRLRRAAILRDTKSGRRMEIWTTERSLRVFGSHGFNSTIRSKASVKPYARFSGVGFEARRDPGLRPGETFRSHTEYRFRTE